MPGYFIYCRKSSEAEDRQVLSIESQVNDLQQMAARLGVTVIEILSESKSAKEPGRPVFNQMMQRLYRGEAAGVLCWKLDRLARNPVDGGTVIWGIKQHNIRIVTPSQSFAREDDNVILMYIEFGMAQKYVDDLSKNVKRGLKTKIEHGWYPGVARLGYLNYTDPITAENRIIKDPDRFSLVQRMWGLLISGLHTPAQVLQIANVQWGLRTRQSRRQGGSPLSRTAFYRLLSDTFYYGVFEYPAGSGKTYAGRHEPMISKKDFETVQRLLNRRDAPRPQMDQGFAFTGMITCGECNRTVTAEVKHHVVCNQCGRKFSGRTQTSCSMCGKDIKSMRNPVRRTYSYYHCSKSLRPSCRQQSVSVQALEQQIEDCLARMEISEAIRDWALKYLEELTERERKAQKEINQSQEKAHRDCLSRLDNLVRLKTSPDNVGGVLLSDEEYGRQRTELLHQKSIAEASLKSTESQIEAAAHRSEEFLRFSCLLRQRFAEGTPKAKKQILSTIGSNLVLMDKKLSIEARKPFFMPDSSRFPSDIEISAIEPHHRGLTRPLDDNFETACPAGRGQRDDDRTFARHSRRWVESLYIFFQGRTLCPCPECQSDFFGVRISLTQRCRPRRRNPLSLAAIPCVFTGGYVANGENQTSDSIAADITIPL